VAMEKRLAWANALLEDGEQPYSEADVVYIHVDKKWFFTTLRNRRFWVAPGEKTPSIAVASKSHITKVMFLGAVARPVQAHGFDGRIGLYPVAEQTRALRANKLRKKGALVWKLVNMDAALFKKYLMEKVVPDALRATGQWAKRIVIQMDNAGGGQGDMNKTTIAELNEWAQQHLRRNGSLRRLCGRQLSEIEFVAQPPRSPDTNALDLGIWTSLQVAVEARKYERRLQNKYLYEKTSLTSVGKRGRAGKPPKSSRTSSKRS